MINVMKKYTFKPENISKKGARFFDKKNLDLAFNSKEKSKLKQAILHGQKICPELVLNEYKNTAEISVVNTMQLFNYQILNSIKTGFEKQNSFVVLPDISVNNNTIIASTLQAHNREINVFKYKSKSGSFTALGTNISNLKCGINQNGIFIAYHKIYTQNNHNGITPGMIMRIVLERAKGLNQATEILHTIPHAENASYLVCSGDRHLIFETAEGINKILYPQKYYLSLSNHFLSEELKPEDIREQIFPANISVQRDAHVVYYLVHARRKVDVDTIKRILGNTQSGICSDEGELNTKYSLYYEYGKRDMFVALGPPTKNKFKKISLY